MTTRKHEKPKSSSFFMPRNHDEWFAYNLYNDIDFIRKKSAIIRQLKSLIPSDEYTVMMLLARKQGLIRQLKERIDNSASGIQFMLLAAKKQKLSDISDGPEGGIIKNIEALSKRFHVSTAIIERGLLYRKGLTAIRALPAVCVEGDEVVIRIDATMRLKDIKESYAYILELQSKLPGYRQRNRAKVRPDLIYAIYKQRLQSKTFREIYLLYESRTLPGYDGDNAITGEEAFARMYNKFRPDS